MEARQANKAFFVPNTLSNETQTTKNGESEIIDNEIIRDETIEDYVTKKEISTIQNHHISRKRDETEHLTKEKALKPIELFPFPKEIEIEKVTLLEALKEEPKIEDPEAIYEECLKCVKRLREQRILYDYVLNDDEVGALCAITKLNKSTFDLKELFKSTKKEKALSKLAVLVLRSIRKLPWFRGTFYFESSDEIPVKDKSKGYVVRPSFFLAHTGMLNVSEAEQKKYLKKSLLLRTVGGTTSATLSFVRKRQKTLVSENKNTFMLLLFSNFYSKVRNCCARAIDWFLCS